MTKKLSVGVVVIGRNEGDRLKRCIQSLVTQAQAVVYVDSNSSDGSVSWVQSQGLNVVELDLSRPFTAARARNEGFDELTRKWPNLSYVQFVDGDCEVDSNWLDFASDYLSKHDQVAVACGRRREKFPHKTIYNQLCDIEWNTPIGNTKSCGGDALMRVSVLKEVSGFRSEVIAGEEPELCVRIRTKGYQVVRLDAEMTMHDAEMTQFSQWWKRAKRCGYANALGAWIHGRSTERFRLREVTRVIIWAGVIPALAIAGLLVTSWSLLLLVLYPLQFLKLLKGNKQIPSSAKYSWAFFTVIGKFPELAGIAKFSIDCILDRKMSIIEYK